MAKTYRKIQQWDRWLEHFPGRSILEAESAFLPHLLGQYYGNHILLIGTPRQHFLLKSTNIVNRLVLSPLQAQEYNSNIRHIESEFYELPIASGSVDIVILPHSLEYVDNPQKLLAESCRIVRPEGHIFITGFNPYSLWGLKKLWTKHHSMPWSGNFINASTIKKWLALADFKFIKHNTMLFRPPINHATIFNKLKFLEWIGAKCCLPVGGIYTIVAQAKVIPLTPIKLRWKQKISDLKLQTIGAPRPTTRNHP